MAVIIPSVSSLLYNTIMAAKQMHAITILAAIKAKHTLVWFYTLLLRMITCSLCTACFGSVSIFLSHLRLIHASEAGFQVSCGLQGCQRTFTNFYTYRNHVYSMHDLSGLDSITVGSNNPSMNTTNSTGVDNTNTDIEMSHDTEASYETSAVATLSEGTYTCQQLRVT